MTKEKKRVVLITGGIKGIGAAIARKMAYAGDCVIANYHHHRDIAEKFSQESGVAILKWDVRSYDECKKNIMFIEETYGPIDILVNNAGITKDSMLHKMSPDMWNDVLSTNLTSVFNMCRLVVPGMRENKFGRIINISSVNGLKGQVGQTNYSASKAGMIGFTKALAQEVVQKNITVNCIAPGYTNTEMVSSIPQDVLQGIIKSIPMNRLCSPEEIAHCAFFLASRDSGFITGTVLSINGCQYIPT